MLKTYQYKSIHISHYVMFVLLQVSTELCVRSPSTSARSEDTPTSTMSHGTSAGHQSPASGEQTESFSEKPRRGAVAQAGMATTPGVLTNLRDL